MALLDQIMKQQRPQEPQMADTPQGAEGIFPKSSLQDPSGGQQSPFAGAARNIGRAVKKLNLAPTPENVSAVVQAAANKRPLDPNSLIGRRRAKIQSQMQDIVHSLKTDFNVHRLNEAMKEQQRLQKIAAGKGIPAAAARKQLAGGLELSPDIQKLAAQKQQIVSERLAGFQKQLVELDSLENKVALAQGLDSDDYRDAITQLLTGQPVKTSTTMEKADLKLRQREQGRKELEDERSFSLDVMQEKFKEFESQRDFGLEKIRTDAQVLTAYGKFYEGEAAKKTADTLSKSSESKLETDYVDLEKQFSTINDIAGNLDLDAFTVSDKLVKWGVDKLDKLDLTDPEQKAYLEGRREQKQNIKQMFNSYRKLITGAAAAEKELEDLKQSMLNEDLSPSDARAAVRQLLVNVMRDQMVIQKVLASGISRDNSNFNTKYIAEKLKWNRTMRASIEKQVIEQYPHLAKGGGNKKSSPKPGIQRIDANTVKFPDGTVMTREEIQRDLQGK